MSYSDVVKWEPSPTGRGRRRSRDAKGNQEVGDFRFTNILELFSIYFFFSITLLYHFFYTFLTHDIYPHPHPRPTTSTHYPRLAFEFKVYKFGLLVKIDTTNILFVFSEYVLKLILCMSSSIIFLPNVKQPLKKLHKLD